MNDAASGVAQFAYKCILEHFFVLVGTLFGTKARQDIQDSDSKKGDNLLQRETIYSKVDYPQGPCMHRFWGPVYFVTETLRASCRRYLIQNVLFRVFFLLDPSILHSCICILTLVSFCSQRIEDFKEQSPHCLQCGFRLAQEQDPIVRHFGLQLIEHFVK